MASAEQLSKVDSAIEAGDAKDGKAAHRRASSTASNVHNIVDLGKLAQYQWTIRVTTLIYVTMLTRGRKGRC